MKSFAQKLSEVKRLKKAVSVITASILICTSVATVTLKAAANEELPTPILKYENLKITTENQVVDVSNKIDELKNLEEGTIIARFKPNTDAAIMDLFSISDNTTENVYYALYVKPGTVGFEARTRVNGTDTHLGDINGSYSAPFKGVNTVALKVDKNYGYKIFFNGKLVKDQSAATVHFFNSIANVNKAAIGKIFRGGGRSSWLYNGYLDFLDIYSQPLSDEYLLQKTGETGAVGNIQLPDGVYKSQPVDLFYPGMLGSNNYRIPSLITTKKGNVIAGIDARISNGGDSPNNIDSAVRISSDGGKTWGEAKKVIDYPDSASTIDTELLQDTSTGRIFMLVDAFPQGYGFWQAKQGIGYKDINGKKYLQLFDASENEYTVRENGAVFNNAGIITSYTTDADNNLYQNGVKVGNTYGASSPLKVYGTCYLVVVYSDDEGATWSKPIDLNPMVKKEWMRFCGTGPGRGLQLKVGQLAGRLVFPIYYTNVNGKQSSAVIYSDDHGATWKMGESPNDGRVEGTTIIDSQTLNESTYELTESQVVELPDGQLKLFCRNYGGKVSVATSFDGGATWYETVTKDAALTDPYCQMTAINYSQKVDGYDAIIFANPNSSSRVNGTVRIGLIKENGTYNNGRKMYTFDWKYSKVVKGDTYAYSCLTELPNGNIGLFYEGTGSQQMSYTEMNIDYIKYNPATKVAALMKVQFLDSKEAYKEGDTFGVKFTFDERVIAIGQKNMNAQIGSYNVPLTMTQSGDGKELIFQGKIASIPNGTYDCKVTLPTALEVFNGVGAQYINDGTVRTLGIVKIGVLTPPVDGAVDKEALNEAIRVAQAKYDASASGQYSKTSRYALLAAINVAKAVSKNTASTQLSIDAALKALKKAVATFDGIIISEVNKEALNEAIRIAQAKHDAAVVGDAVGQYPQTSKNALLAAVNAAKAVSSNTASTQTNVDGAVIALNYAVKAFDASRITEEVPLLGDVNGDGKIMLDDLVLVAQANGKREGEVGYRTEFDINKDKVIDEVDLTYISNKILEQ